VPDPIFAEPRLAAIYDALDPDRSDLEAYVAMVEEFGATRVLDLGCGTGCLALLLVARGCEVVAVDPAAASLEVAKHKPGAGRVAWMLGDATSLPALSVDVAVMTGNVAQVFTDDAHWAATLRGLRAALRADGRLIFEIRNPQREAWREWTPDQSFRRLEIPGVGIVESWVETLDVRSELVTFRWTYRFLDDATVLTSQSTLRFRSRAAVTQSLLDGGFRVDEVRDAPDRPGLELVFVASRVD
jgi:SAM-dependent methyltransferase